MAWKHSDCSGCENSNLSGFPGGKQCTTYPECHKGRDFSKNHVQVYLDDEEHSDGNGDVWACTKFNYPSPCQLCKLDRKTCEPELIFKHVR